MPTPRRARTRRPRSTRAARPSAGWIDISMPLRSNMVCWPGDPPVRIERVQDLARGDHCNVSALSLGAHTGTHIDAPLHFLPDGAGVDALPLDAAVGPARVIGIRDPEAIHAAELRRHGLRRGHRVLFRTRNSAQDWASDEFREDYVYVAPDAAEYLAQRGVRTVGVDYLSVGGFERDNRATHVALLGAGIWVIEGLNLARIRPGTYDLICLPLRLVGAEGSPARAIVRRRRT